jgi:single-strand DNA-binding protein
MVTKQKLTVTGNLTDDPTLDRTGKGLPFAKARVAVNYGSGENRTTEYFDVRVWSSEYAPNFPENVCSSLRRGDRVTVTGSIESSGWLAPDNTVRSAISIHADEVSASLRYATADITKNPRTDAPSYGNQRARGGVVIAPPQLAASTEDPSDPFAALEDSIF